MSVTVEEFSNYTGYYFQSGWLHFGSTALKWLSGIQVLFSIIGLLQWYFVSVPVLFGLFHFCVLAFPLGFSPPCVSLFLSFWLLIPVIWVCLCLHSASEVCSHQVSGSTPVFKTWMKWDYQVIRETDEDWRVWRRATGGWLCCVGLGRVQSCPVTAGTGTSIRISWGVGLGVSDSQQKTDEGFTDADMMSHVTSSGLCWPDTISKRLK